MDFVSLVVLWRSRDYFPFLSYVLPCWKLRGRRSRLRQGTSVISLNQDQKSWGILLKIITGGLQHIHSFIHSQSIKHSFIHSASISFHCLFICWFIRSLICSSLLRNFSKHSLKAILEEVSRSRVASILHIWHTVKPLYGGHFLPADTFQERSGFI